MVVGADIRHSSESLKLALSQGLMDGGVDIIDIGMTGTEKIYGFNHLDFIKLTGKFDVFSMEVKLERDLLCNELNTSKTKENALQMQVAELEKQLNEFHNSNSWKITAPIRSLVRLFKIQH